MSIGLEKKLLAELLAAEEKKQPLIGAELSSWIKGSTFEDCWDDGYIQIVGQEGKLLVHTDKDSQYILTPRGRSRLEELQQKAV